MPSKSLYDLLTDYSMFGAIAFETLGVATIFVFRNRIRAADPGAYRSPLYPAMPILYVIAMAAVLLNMFWTNQKESIVAVGFMGVGAIVYVLFLGLTVLGLRAWLAAYRHRQLLTAAPVESTVAGEAERLAA